MKPARHRFLLLASHGLAIGAGVLAWQVSITWNVVPSPSRSAAAGARAFRNLPPGPGGGLREMIAKVREEARRNAEEIEFHRTATLPQTLARYREKTQKFLQEREVELAVIREKAKAFDGLADPADSIRRIIAARGKPEEWLPIYHSWLRRDRDSALESLSKEDDLHFFEKVGIGDLIVDALGGAWAEAALNSDAVPYPLRLALAENAGQHAGQQGGLASLLKLFVSTPDSRLRAVLTERFVRSWVFEDPRIAAQFLAGEAPMELRDFFLHTISMTRLSGAWKQWRIELIKELEAYPLPDYARETAETFPLSNPPGFFGPHSPDDRPLEEVMRNGGSSGGSVESVMLRKVHDWIEEGTDLRELYSENRISRQELLDQLKARIPGSAAYALELERAAWAETLPSCDPEEAAAWGRELLRHGDLSSLLDDAIRKFSCDDREAIRLARLRVAADLNPKPHVLEFVADESVESWQAWQSLSPSDANRWRASLNWDHPLVEVLAKADDRAQLREEEK